MLIGDILTCLFVSCRLFLALVIVVNLLVWLFLVDDDADAGARQPVQGNPDGPRASSSSSRAPCILPRLCCFRACRRRSPQNDESVTPGTETLQSDVVGEDAESEVTDEEDRPRSIGAACSVVTIEIVNSI